MPFYIGRFRKLYANICAFWIPKSDTVFAKSDTNF